MDILGFDITQLFALQNLLAILIGTVIGLLFGAIPGLGLMIAFVLILPMTYMFTPLAAILCLLAVFQSAEYGGSISSIVLGIPGTPVAVPTLLDGRPMAKEVSPGKAISYSLTASTIGGLFGAGMLIFLSIPMSAFALQLSNPEFFMLGILGLIGVVFLGSPDFLKGLISCVLGLLTGVVGTDLITGTTRFTADMLSLTEGVGMLALIVGVFALPEILTLVSEHLKTRYVTDKNKLKWELTFKEVRKVAKPTAIGSAIGSTVGIMPGMGSGTSSWFSYALAKKTSKKPELFGKGSPEGIAAPESSNNATVGGALLPTLTLGIPGSPGTAVILGAFIIHGIQPGPQIFESNTDLVYGLFFGFILTSIFMYGIGRILTPLFARVLTLRNEFLVPCILLLSFVGVYVADRLFFDVWFALIVGIIFFILRKLKFSLPAFILGFILLPIIEVSLRRTLIISDGSFMVFLTRPYSLVILLLILAVVFFPLIKQLMLKIRS